MLYTMRTTPDMIFRDVSSMIPEAMVYPGKRITIAPKEMGVKQNPCLHGAKIKVQCCQFMKCVPE